VTSFVTISALTPAANAQQGEPPKSARVSGVVVDAADGHLLRRAMVCFRRGADTGYYGSGDVYCNETDVQGRFALTDLPPGRYAYGVDRAGYFAADPLADQLSSLIALKAGDELSGIKLRMQRAGSIFGRVVFDDGEPFPGAELQLAGPSDARVKTSVSGEYRFDDLRPGDYRVRLNPPNITGNCDDSRRQRERLYVRQGAGADDPEVRVNLGREARGPDIVMMERMPRRIAGRVVLDAYPLPGVWWVRLGNARVAVKNLDGSFIACGLAPGEYTLRTDARVGGHIFAGDLKIRIEDEDLKDLEINAESAASIRARIQVEDSATLDLAKTEIYPIWDSAPPHDQLPSPRRQSDGSFVIEEIYSGEYRFYLTPLPSGSYLKSARIDGQDIVDAPILVRSGEQLGDLIFAVSLKAGIVTGVVQDATGNAVPNAMVILQPDPRHADIDVHECSRTTDQKGEFTCDNLAPGKYKVAAWRTYPEHFPAWSEVTARGDPVEVSESGRPAITVKVLP
jgi:hypothetical protein